MLDNTVGAQVKMSGQSISSNNSVTTVPNSHKHPLQILIMMWIDVMIGFLSLFQTWSLVAFEFIVTFVCPRRNFGTGKRQAENVAKSLQGTVLLMHSVPFSWDRSGLFN